jgi:hypothetical protein
MKQPEKVEQAHGVQLLRSLGAAVYVSGTRRRRGDYQGTMQSLGIPDVEAWLPRRLSDGDAPARRLLKWEVKAAGAWRAHTLLTPEQRDYAELCYAAGVAHVCGDYDALVTWLVINAYLDGKNLPHYRPAASRLTTL